MPLACWRTERCMVLERNHPETGLSGSVAATLTTPEYETASAARISTAMAARKPDVNLMTYLPPQCLRRTRPPTPGRPAEHCSRQELDAKEPCKAFAYMAESGKISIASQLSWPIPRRTWSSSPSSRAGRDVREVGYTRPSLRAAASDA